ncbi:transglutaminase-like domain-containing protein [Ramlibacter sp. PS4R-6]|uniref:transglutaminase-like domain-containing protein n=1 Tax=Ramlibacter sp. PS4R-6 TaxID=3133438 RepID=UPI003099C83D
MPTPPVPPARPPHPSALAEPEHWLASTELLDLDDSKLRLRARSLTQLSKTEREKALAIYGFVKRVPFAKPFKLRLRSPRQVLEAGRGDALDKVGLLLALLRISGIPARMRYMHLPGEMLRGLISHMSITARPVAEVWIGGRWAATDTYIFDAAYMAAARQRLAEEGWDCGYGIHRDGASIWNGADDAFLVGTGVAQDGLVPGGEGLFEDPFAFVNSTLWREAHPALASTVHWNIMVPSMGKVIRELREEAVAPAPPAAGRRAS